MGNKNIEIEKNPHLKLLDLQEISQDPIKKWLIKIFQKPIEKTFSIESLNNAYLDSIKIFKDENYFNSCLRSLNVNYVLSLDDLYKIPESGPLITVANHPFGGIEGVILGHIMLRIRSDIKILGNFLLQKIPELRPWIIPVDPFDSQNSKSANFSGLKEAIRWLKSGGALITFPSGEVSYLNFIRREVTDPNWNTHLGSIIKHTKASVIPFYFPEKNSYKFQLLGLLHPRMRTAMLPHELVNKNSRAIKVRVGNVLPFKRFSNFKSDSAIIDFLRFNTYNLKYKIPQNTLKKSKISNKSNQEALVSVKSNLITKEINSLTSDNLLSEFENLKVYIADSYHIPNILRQIGYLREKTFREVNEGTGKALDIDQFDKYYSHLFLWNADNKEIIGAYRVGKTDQIIAKYGLQGLYTNTLFHYKSQLKNHIKDALELGRSFIVNEYQKSHSALSLLWRGIGEYIVRNPKYKKLFGPVSISQDYHNVSKSLIVQFLKSKKNNAEISKYIIPRNPYKNGKFKKFESDTIENTIKEIEEISILVSEIEHDGKGVPILLRNYLKLNAKMVGFNVDPDFSDVLDCLIMVDLRTTKEKLLKRFMGHQGFEIFKSN